MISNWSSDLQTSSAYLPSGTISGAAVAQAVAPIQLISLSATSSRGAAIRAGVCNIRQAGVCCVCCKRRVIGDVA